MHTLLIRTYQTDENSGQIHMMRIRPVEDQMHSHAFFELVYVMRGSAIHHIGAEETSLTAGDYFIIDTGSTHCYKNPVDFEIVNCLFLPEYVDRALENCPSLSALLSNQVLRFGVPVETKAADRTCHDADGAVMRIIEAMEAEYAARRTGYMELLRCYLTQVLVYTVRAAAKTPHTHEATAAIVEYLRSHLAEPLSLDTLSRKLGYTAQYLSCLFRKDTGMPMQVFLQRLRIEEACRLMSRRELPLSELAQMVGYSDVKHFSRVFRTHKGISVREFRASITKL